MYLLTFLDLQYLTTHLKLKLAIAEAYTYVTVTEFHDHWVQALLQF